MRGRIALKPPVVCRSVVFSIGAQSTVSERCRGYFHQRIKFVFILFLCGRDERKLYIIKVNSQTIRVTTLINRVLVN